MHSLVLASWRLLVPVVQNLKYAIPTTLSTMAGTAVKINFNTKHLKKGDPLPAYNGKLRIYNMRYCPFAQRTILVLNAKKIDYEVVNIDLVDKPEWLTSKSLFGNVPALEVKDGVCIAESLVTSEYLDEVYPQRPLLPKDPVKKALAKVLVETMWPIQQIMCKIIRAPDELAGEPVADYHNYLKFIEDQLTSAGTKFLGGAEPGFTDYMIWPWFERILTFSKKFEVIKIDPTKFKIASEYLANMLKDPAVSQYLVPAENTFKFIEAYAKGSQPDYNMLSEE